MVSYGSISDPRARWTRWVFSGFLPLALAVYIAFLAIVVLGRDEGSVSVGHLAAVVIFCGFAAAALIETAKRLLPVRAFYQRQIFEAWVNGRIVGEAQSRALIQLAALLGGVTFESSAGPNSGENDVLYEGAYRQWRKQATGLGGLFNLPPEQLVAQLNAALELAMLQAAQHPELLRLFAGEPGFPPSHAMKSESKESPVAIGQRAAVAIDQLLVLMSGRWQQYVRATASWLSGLVALILGLAPSLNQMRAAAFPIAALLFGGFIATTVRDLTAFLERARR